MTTLHRLLCRADALRRTLLRRGALEWLLVASILAVAALLMVLTLADPQPAGVTVEPAP